MCSLIADCTSVEDRNKFLAYLEAVVSAAFIIGPAIGGFLGSQNYSFPLYFAGGVAGIALLFALFMMEETNKDVHVIYELRSEMKGKTGGR
mgnify:FL=1